MTERHWPGETPSTETCWAEIDLSALRRNFRLLRSLSPSSPVLAIVKANAYGHGAPAVARTLLSEGAEALGVATVSEGRELREAGITGSVVVLGRILAGEVAEGLRWGLEITVPDQDLGAVVSAAARKAGVTARVHLKVDTGMTRLGVPWEAAAETAAHLLALPGLSLAGIFTHFANADLADSEVTRTQVARFAEVAAKASALGIRAPFHMANSAALLSRICPPEMGVRPGIALYGSPPTSHPAPPGLVPVLSWKCRVLQVRRVPAGTGVSYGHAFVTRRPSCIATVALGYADGFPRSLTNRARLLVRGRKVPVAGRVCMDMTMLDVTEVEGVRAGDEVVVIGRQGEASVTAEELAALAGTISYEIFCAISPRVPRYYRDEALESRQKGEA